MDDLISRAAATRAAVISVRDYLGNIDSERDIHIEEGLHEVPAVEAVPVVYARWKLIAWHRRLKVVECSICRKWAYGATAFCPHCAARMDGERRENA